MNLARHRVFITGGTRGIGFALAKTLMARGAAVAVCGRDAQRVKEVQSQLPSVSAFECDLAELDRLPNMLDSVRSSFGSPTILVNNAGVQFNHSWLKASTPEVVRKLMTEIAVNLTSPLTLTALLLDDLVKAEESAVVNISSLLAMKPKRSAPVYCATKAAIRSFGQALRYQLASYPHVRVVEVVPPLVDTGMTAGRGKGKISADQAAQLIATGLERDMTDIYIGKAKIMRILNRLSPATVGRLLRDG